MSPGDSSNKTDEAQKVYRRCKVQYAGEKTIESLILKGLIFGQIYTFGSTNLGTFTLDG